MQKVVWFEIAVKDASKTLPFYEEVFSWKTEPYKEAPEPTRAKLWHVYTREGEAIGGIYETDQSIGGNSVEIYLSVFNIDHVLKEVVKRGGKIDLKKTKNPSGAGYYARFLDLEGNIMGIWCEE